MEGTAAPYVLGIIDNVQNSSLTIHFAIFSRTDISRLPDLTGQIFGKIDNYVAAGGFGSVYQCDWRRPTSSPVKVCALPVQLADQPIEQVITLQVAVKVIRCPTSEQDKVILRVWG